MISRLGPRASPVVLKFVTLQKYFSYPSFGSLLFSNPTHKTKTGTANRWETTNSNPHGPTELSSQLTAGFRLCCAFHQPLPLVQKCWAKAILVSQTSMF
jgi:hypothetical protein